jgi:hypothetical protein
MAATTRKQSAGQECRAAMVAMIVGFLLTMGIRAVAKIPGEWLGWLLQCWGMA